MSLSAKGTSSSGETRYSCKAFEQLFIDRAAEPRTQFSAESIVVGGKEFEPRKDISRFEHASFNRSVNLIGPEISFKDLKTVLLINDSSSTLKVLQSGKIHEELGEPSFAKTRSCPNGERRGKHAIKGAREPNYKLKSFSISCITDDQITQEHSYVKAEIIPDSTPIAFKISTKESSSGTITSRSSEYMETPSHIREEYPEYRISFREPDNVLTIVYRGDFTHRSTAYGCALETL